MSPITLASYFSEHEVNCLIKIILAVFNINNIKWCIYIIKWSKS